MDPRFSSDEEAIKFVNLVTSGRELPLEVWVKILTNSGLPLIDVERMCHVNQSFASLCTDTGELWRQMFVQKFGLAEFRQKLKDMEPYRLTKDEAKHLKLIFFAAQIQKYGPPVWILSYRKKGVSITLTNKGSFILGQWAGSDTSLFDSLANQLVKWLGPYTKSASSMYNWGPTNNFTATQTFAIIYTALFYGLRSHFKQPYLQSCLLHPAAAAQALCGVCRQAAYCSQACADADWAAHKMECRK